MKKIEILQKMIDESNNIVFFGGAGVSTESGIPDFRSKDGIYNQKYTFPPEYLLSNRCFYENTEAFYEFYKEKMNFKDKKPNYAHKYLKKLENRKKLKAIVTQNIDNLHQKAGSTNVYELHGTIYKNHCIKCKKEYSYEYVFNSKGIPKCSCGNLIKPDVVLYGEILPKEATEKALKAIKEANMLIIAGTSLTVYPACEFINYFSGKYLVIINKDKTLYDKKASLVIHDNLKTVFEQLN